MRTENDRPIGSFINATQLPVQPVLTRQGQCDTPLCGKQRVKGVGVFRSANLRVTLGGLAGFAVLVASLSACAHGSSVLVPDSNQRSAQVLRPVPVDGGGNGGAPGSTYINTNCSASDSSCVGPWQSGQTGTDAWETASPEGNGHWIQTLQCADVGSCSALGYTNTIAHYETMWAWNSGYGIDSNNGDLDSVDTAYSPGCDPSMNLDFPDSCAIQSIAALGKHAPQGASCLGSGLSIGAVPGGPTKGDTYANQISNIYYVKSSGLGNGISGLFGWVYQTPGDGWYLQPNVSVQFSAGVAVAQIGVTPGTPWVSIASNSPADIANGLQRAANTMNVTLPPSFLKVITSGIKMSSTPCWFYPWDGRYTSSTSRRAR